MNILQGLIRAAVLSATACLATGALADGHSASVSEDDLASIKKAIGGFGCKAQEAEAEGGGFEIEAAACENGAYEIELDSKFNVLSLSLVTEGEGKESEETADASALENDIMALLATMRCEMDPDDIEVEGDEIELDDVFCGGGQFDINLNSDLYITGMLGE